MKPLISGKPYFPNLDASRFFAFMLVFSAHAFIGLENLADSPIKTILTRISKTGFLGLEYFFVLSSFLISWLILNERKNTGEFKALSFMMRRILRVWPLYFLIIFIGYVVVPNLTPIITGSTVSELPNIWYHLTFLVNFYIIENDNHYLLFLTFLWSISIEEQFYLVWAGLMKWLRKGFVSICTLLIIVSMVFRYMFIAEPDVLYYHTISTLGNFGTGGLLAWLVFNKNNVLQFIHHSCPRWIATVPYLLFGLSYVFYFEVFCYPSTIVVERFWFSILFAAIIADQAFNENRIIALGSNKLLDYLGKISYGLYCFHGVVISVLIVVIRHYDFIPDGWLKTSISPIVILLCTILVAHVSFRYFESYFLRLKSHFYPHDQKEHS